MFDEKKQIVYWKTTALDNLETAEILFEKGKFRECLFFCHLTIEKLLKAHFVNTQKDFAPKVHELLYLLSKTNLKSNEDTKDFLGTINDFNLEGRYPENFLEIPNNNDVYILLNKTKECVEWLVKLL